MAMLFLILFLIFVAAGACRVAFLMGKAAGLRDAIAVFEQVQDADISNLLTAFLIKSKEDSNAV